MLFKKMLRTIGHYKAQFISMIIMIAIGVGVFLGFNMEWVSIDKNVSDFVEATNFADYRVYSTSTTFSTADVEKIKNIEGVDEVSRFVSFNADVEGTDGKNQIAITMTENFNVSSFIVVEGEEYDPTSTSKLWLFYKYAEANGVDNIKLEVQKGVWIELKATPGKPACKIATPVRISVDGWYDKIVDSTVDPYRWAWEKQYVGDEFEEWVQTGKPFYEVK